jgi:hypothetical protein
MAAKRVGDIRIKRAYEPSAPADGTRILVDRLWPRGVTKEALALERWARSDRAMRYAAGSATIPTAGPNSAVAIPPSWRSSLRSSRNCAASRATTR